MVLSKSFSMDDHVEACSLVALFGLSLFLLAVTLIGLFHIQHLFLSQHGWTHRLFGALHLLWLDCGAFLAVVNNNEAFISARTYDLILGVLGVQATLTAARDFPHKHVSNAAGQSGTLHRKAIVTQAEMIEHAFYQFLNLWQVLYLHILDDLGETSTPVLRLGLLWLVSSPWLFRHWLPVHSFSQNWKLANTSDEEISLYRIKKMQYLFYKHVILHGVNISSVVSSSSGSRLGIPNSQPWRVFWLALNTSYVMEFFLQTMVRRKVISQSIMIWLQRGLMGVSSLAAAVVLRQVSVLICALSLILNFINRHHDVLNTTMIGFAAVAITNVSSKLTFG